MKFSYKRDPKITYKFIFQLWFSLVHVSALHAQENALKQLLAFYANQTLCDKHFWKRPKRWWTTKHQNILTVFRSRCLSQLAKWPRKKLATQTNEWKQPVQSKLETPATVGIYQTFTAGFTDFQQRRQQRQQEDWINLIPLKKC